MLGKDPNEIISRQTELEEIYSSLALGNILFLSGEHSLSEDNVRKFDEALYESAYSIIYRELTPKEKEILMTSLEDDLNKGIMERASMSKSQLSNYKSVLAKKGILEENNKSIVFALPRFKEFFTFMKAIEDDGR